jgi:predicted nucleic acid-binding Zn ribbon protein
MKDDQNASSLKDAIESFLNDYGLKDRYLQNRVMTDWEEIMGKMVARHTTDIYIKDHKLFLYIDSAALKHELTQGKELIVKRVNENVGEVIISEVMIR